MKLCDREQIILAIVGRYADRSVEPSVPGEALDSLGIDSLKFIMMILEIESVLDSKIFDIGNVGRLRTVDDLLAVVRGTQLSNSG